MNNFKTLILAFISIIAFTAQAHASPAWAAEVHNLLITAAFPDESWQCLVAMQRGSADADGRPYQAGKFSYMHAMRVKGQDPQEASKLMWSYIDQKYAEVQVLDSDGRNDDACYMRGMALHPIMDSTSPAHTHFTEWDPLEYTDIFNRWVIPGKLIDMVKHGDVDGWVKRHMYITLPFIISEENMRVIDEHPELKDLTVSMMRLIDKLERQSL